MMAVRHWVAVGRIPVFQRSRGYKTSPAIRWRPAGRKSVGNDSIPMAIAR
jgi:hypothetical protein